MTYWTSRRPTTRPARRPSSSHGTEHRYGPYEKQYIRKDGSTYACCSRHPHDDASAGRHLVDRAGYFPAQGDGARAGRGRAHDKLTGLANRAMFMERLQKPCCACTPASRRCSRVLPGFRPLQADQHTLAMRRRRDAAPDRRRLRGACARGRAGPDLSGTWSAASAHEFLVLINDLTSHADADVDRRALLHALSLPTHFRQRAALHRQRRHRHQRQELCERRGRAAQRGRGDVRGQAVGRGCSVIFNEAMHTRSHATS